MITINAKLSSDPYYILGVDRETNFTEIKKQYFLLAKKYHPDLNPNNEVMSI
jgi:molecular chaperone DnaJ